MIALALTVFISSGAIDTSCTKEKVCQDGYTATVRPSVSYTNYLKRAQMKERGITDDPKDYEEDHFIPLELCGHPWKSENLWPEPWPEARKKDVDETALHRAVCDGSISLEQAQAQIMSKWRIH